MRRAAIWIPLLGALLAAPSSFATNLSTTYSSEFLVIGNSINDAVLASNYQYGANQATVPMAGLTLVQPIPANTLPVATGVSGDGEVAVTDPGGQFNLSNLEIYATTGVQCAGTAGDCNNGDSNTTFNGLAFPANGLVAGVDFSLLLGELSTAASLIPTLLQTSVLDVSGSGGEIQNTTHTVSLNAGLNVIDIVTGGGDFKLTNSNLVFDGPSGAIAIVRVPDVANFLVSQSAILVGNGGIGLNNVLIYSDRDDNATHFSFNSMLVNGVAFWDLSSYSDPSEIVGNNVQGCTQLVGNKVNAGQNVRLTRCSFSGVSVPEPSPSPLLGLAFLALLPWLVRLPSRS